MNPTAADLFLTNDEVARLTGFARSSKQVEWLRREGFEFRIAADGYPRILRAHVFKLMGMAEATGRRRSVPDFSAVGA